MLAALGLAAGMAQAGEVFTLSVPQATNLDMDATRMAGILASPDVQVVLFYEPMLAIPGWTGRFGYCSPRHICIKGNAEQLVLSGDKLARQPDSLRVKLPAHHWFGLMPYRLGSMIRITLPPFWPGDLPGNIDLLDTSNGRGDTQPVIDMHLAAPYVGVASYRIDAKADADKSKPYAVPACDATLDSQSDKPAAHPEHLALVAETWLRRLADSAWWSAQISGVQFNLLGGLPAGVEAGKGAPRVVRVTVDRGTAHALHLRARVNALAGTSCPGFAQYDFSWIDGKLMDATISENSEIMGPDECPTVNRLREAQWWQGKLVSYTGPGPTGEVAQWSQWKVAQPECRGDMDPATPDVSALEQAAAVWAAYAQTATVLPPEAESK